jgi:hypothetical protein
MQHEHLIANARNIKHPEGAGWASDPDFNHPGPNERHCLPINWHQALLDTVQLLPGLTSRILGKRLQVGIRSTEKQKVLHPTSQLV